MSVRYVPNDLKAEAALIDWLKQQWFRTRYEFLLQFKGLRLGCSHGILGTTGSGKSTLLKAMLCDALHDEAALWLGTEEPIERVVADLKLIDRTVPLERLQYFHKDDTPDEVRGSYKALWDWYRDLIIASGVRLVFWDNPSTSEFYSVGMPLAGQEYLWEQLQKFVRNNGIALVYTIHTSPNVTDSVGRLIEGEEVRGTKQSFQQADYWFILQRFQLGNKFYPFLRVRKHRFHRFVDKFFFYLIYKDGHFTIDKPVDFEDINSAFLQRNVLGGKKK